MLLKNLRYLGLFVLLLVTNWKMIAQCPINLGFEMGTFENWECAVGIVDQNGVVHMLSQGIYPNRHTIIKNTQHLVDHYGHFPIVSPNGSKYVVKLGNDDVGAQAERISYTFTIPADRNDYAIVYNYAVVFQDPGHLIFQQPRFTAKVFDAITNEYLPCSSYDFIASSSLPGFLLSDVMVNARYNVYYKPWSPATIKLSGYGGKTVRLEFTTNDCTADEHFGYAYIDLNDNCNTVISGNNWCNGNQAVKLTAPFGYEKYYWYDQGLVTLLDSSSTLTIAPPPPDGTVYDLIVNPYPGSGCIDTLSSVIKYLNVPFNFNVPDSAKFCLPQIADLTAPWIIKGNTPSLSYSYFQDSAGASPLLKPDSIINNGHYFIKASDTTNGCTDIKPVIVAINNSPDIIVHDPPVVIYPASVDITNPLLISGNTFDLSFSYWMNSVSTLPLINPAAVDSAGIYFIKATNTVGCSEINPVNVIINIAKPPNAFSPNGDGIHDRWEIPGLKKYPQCSVDIFNRYGQIVFHSTGYSSSWDGKVKGRPIPEGTYYYIIKFNKSLPVLKGYVDIIY